jgi:hypothetical protein
MIDPKLPNRVVRMCQCKTVGSPVVGEKSRIEIQSHALGFGPIDPRLKVCRL